MYPFSKSIIKPDSDSYDGTGSFCCCGGLFMGH